MMKQRIVALAARPESWLGLLLVWTLLSALRSWHTPWARAADTEALRWGAGLLLALALGGGLRNTAGAAQTLTVLLGGLVAAIVFEGRHADGSLVGPYGDHQLCASALLALLPFSLALALTAPTRAWRWGAQIITVAASLCLVLTQTRSAWAGAAVAALVFAVFWLRRSGRSSQATGRRAWVSPALLAAGLAGSFAVLIAGTDLSRPLTSRAQTLQSFTSVRRDASWRARAQAWRGDVGMAAVHPLAGWGLGRYPGAQWAWTHAGRLLTPTQRPSLSEQAHDFYLQTLVETGAVGLSLYLAALAALAGRCLQALRARGPCPEGSRPALLIATLSLIAGQGVDALASPSWQFPAVSLLFWAGLGLGLAATRREWGAEAVAFPPPARRALQLCAVGASTVLLTASALPIGLLLPPVEAYNAPGAAFSSLTITANKTNVSASQDRQVVFTMVLTYSDSAGGHSQNVTLDPVASNPSGNASSYGIRYTNNSGSTPNSTFSAVPSQRNVLTLNGNDGTTPATPFTVQGKISFNGVTRSATVFIYVSP